MPRGLFITFEGLDGSGKTTQIKRLAAWLERRRQGPAAPEPTTNLGAPGLVSETWDPQTLRPGSPEPITNLGAPEPALSLPKGPAFGTWDPPLLTRQPGGTATGDRIRSLTLDSRATGLAPLAEMALMFADRAQAISEVIEPALTSGRIVLCDRFTDSTEAYQGGGRELGSSIVLELHRLLCGNLQPHLTFLLLPPLDASLARARRRNERLSAQTGQDEGRFESEQEAFHRRVRDKYLEIAAREPHRVVLIDGELGIDEVHERIVAAVTARLLPSRLV
jgi:dTMP kinase